MKQPLGQFKQLCLVKMCLMEQRQGSLTCRLTFPLPLDNPPFCLLRSVGHDPFSNDCLASTPRCRSINKTLTQSFACLKVAVGSDVHSFPEVSSTNLLWTANAHTLWTTDNHWTLAIFRASKPHSRTLKNKSCITISALACLSET